MTRLRFTHVVDAPDFGEHMDSTDCPCKPEIKYEAADYIIVIHNPFYEPEAEV